jgi:hypothetical protein
MCNVKRIPVKILSRLKDLRMGNDCFSYDVFIMVVGQQALKPRLSNVLRQKGFYLFLSQLRGKHP